MQKSIVITGASKGIGKYLASHLKNNFEITTLSRSKNELENVSEYLCDLTKNEEIEKFITYSEERKCKYSGVILNAGVGYFGDFLEIGFEKYEEILSLNLKSPIFLLQKIFPFLEKKATIIFMGSIASKKFLKNGAVYQASKFGLRGFAGAIKNERKDLSIHIINPRLVETEFHKNSSIQIDYKEERITKLDDILQVVEEILEGKEKRFEIDI